MMVPYQFFIARVFIAVAFGKKLVPSCQNLHVLMDFAASVNPWTYIAAIFLLQFLPTRRRKSPDSAPKAIYFSHPIYLKLLHDQTLRPSHPTPVHLSRQYLT